MICSCTVFSRLAISYQHFCLRKSSTTLQHTHVATSPPLQNMRRGLFTLEQIFVLMGVLLAVTGRCVHRKAGSETHRKLLEQSTGDESSPCALPIGSAQATTSQGSRTYLNSGHGQTCREHEKQGYHCLHRCNE